LNMYLVLLILYRVSSDCANALKYHTTVTEITSPSSYCL